MIRLGARERVAIMAFQEVQDDLFADLRNRRGGIWDMIQRVNARYGTNYDLRFLEREYPEGVTDTASKTTDGYIIVYNQNVVTRQTDPAFFEPQNLGKALARGVRQSRCSFASTILGSTSRFSRGMWRQLRRSRKATLQLFTALWPTVALTSAIGSWRVTSTFNSQVCKEPSRKHECLTHVYRISKTIRSYTITIPLWITSFLIKLWGTSSETTIRRTGS